MSCFGRPVVLFARKMCSFVTWQRRFSECLFSSLAPCSAAASDTLTLDTFQKPRLCCCCSVAAADGIDYVSAKSPREVPGVSGERVLRVLGKVHTFGLFSSERDAPAVAVVSVVYL